MARPFNRRTFVQRGVSAGIPAFQMEEEADYVGLIYTEIADLLRKHGDINLTQVPEEGMDAIIDAGVEAGRSRGPRDFSIVTTDLIRRDAAEALRSFFDDPTEHSEQGRLLLAGLSAEVAMADGRMDDAEGIEYEGLEDTTARALVFDDAGREDADENDVRLAETIRAVEESNFLQAIDEYPMERDA
jgi:hypothetical protein